jgi:hypothetical protein
VADIKQAAKWMKDGEKVRRPGFFGNFAYRKGRGILIDTTDGNPEDEPLNLSDLVAEDWEIA